MARVRFSPWKKVYGYIEQGFNVPVIFKKYLNFGSTSGESGYGIKDENGIIQVKNDGGSWTDIGSGGIPGGSDTQVQFNDSGAFGGNSGLTYDKAKQALYSKTIAAGATPFDPIVPIQGIQTEVYSVSQPNPAVNTSFAVVPDLAASSPSGVATSIGNIASPSGNEITGAGNLIANGQTINFQFVAYKVINGVRYYSPISNVAVADNINDGSTQWYAQFIWSAAGSPDGYVAYDDYTSQIWDLGNVTTANYQAGATWDVGTNTGENININVGWLSAGGTAVFNTYSYGLDPTFPANRYYSPTNTAINVTEPASGEAYMISFDPGTLVTGATGVKFIDPITTIGVLLNAPTDTSYWYFTNNNASDTITPTSYGILSAGQTQTYSVYPLVQIVKSSTDYYPIYGPQSSTANAVFPNDGLYRTVTVDWYAATANFLPDGTSLYGYKIKKTASAVDTYILSDTSSSFSTAPITNTFTNNTIFGATSTLTPTSFTADVSILENDAPNADPVLSTSTVKPQLTLKSTVTNGMAGLRLVDATDQAKMWIYDFGTKGNLRVANGHSFTIGNYSSDWLSISAGGIITLTSPLTIRTTSANQLRLYYDLSHSSSFSVGSTGITTLTSTAGFTFASAITMNSGINFTLSTVGGTKFGLATNQKLAFYGLTPIIQPANTLDLGTVLSNLGLRASGTAYPIVTSGTINITSASISFSKFTSYAGLTLAGNGLPATVGKVDLTAQVAAKAATTIYTPTTSGMFKISIILQVTRAATTSSVLGGATGVVITYTEPDGSVAQTIVPLLVDQAGAVINPTTGNTGNTTTTSSQGEATFYAKSGVAIRYAIGYTSVGATTMQYSFHAKLQAL